MGYFVIIAIGFGVGFSAIGTQFLPEMDEGNLYNKVRDCNIDSGHWSGSHCHILLGGRIAKYQFGG
jgi:hypothetical protein